MVEYSNGGEYGFGQQNCQMPNSSGNSCSIGDGLFALSNPAANPRHQRESDLDSTLNVQ
jgi:hypothetical protein